MASRTPWVTSARAFLGEGAFLPTSGEGDGVLVTQCLMDILEEGINLGEAHGLVLLCLPGVQAAANWVFRVPVGVFVDRGRSPESMGAQAAGCGEDTDRLPAVKALAGVLCVLARHPGRGETSSLMRNTAQQIKDSPCINSPSN